MTVFCYILKACYQDSIALMQVALKVKSIKGISEAGFFMGTASNKEVLLQSGLMHQEAESATSNDIILSILAENSECAKNGFEKAKDLILSKQQEFISSNTEIPIKSLNEAKNKHSNLNLCIISVAGQYARHEAMRALQNNINVFLFSDNISLQAELALKKEAVRRDLLCMGPDCGTAWIDGIGIGFANEILYGNVGIISASGTGLQAVACYLSNSGIGISHGIGVGGRDLKTEIGGLMTLKSLEMLENDSNTDTIVLISKPPAKEVLKKINEKLASITKPCIICMLGAVMPYKNINNICYVDNLTEAARQVCRIKNIKANFLTVSKIENKNQKRILGLYTGGTLAHEAHIFAEKLLGTVDFDNIDSAINAKNSIIDLGGDEFTRGMPHPMIAPEIRGEYMKKLASNPKYGVLLFDIVLGRCSHDDPASSFIEALEEVRQNNQNIIAVGSVIGTKNDKQDVKSQFAKLTDAGCYMFEDNASASVFACNIIREG